MKAQHYIKLDENKVECTLCPHNCVLKDGKSGICKVRSNHKGELITDNYGKISGYHFDPIEKKPLYHFYPGMDVLSIGSVGCNLHCQFCQNHEIAQTGVRNYPYLKELSPGSVVNAALRRENNIGIAYTYNEPLVFYEFMKDTALNAKQNGLKNVMVTNGFINREPMKSLVNFIDAFSVDLKAFTDVFYKKTTSSKLLPVLESLKTIKQSGKLLEITNLVIPTLNDNEEKFEEMVLWISKELGKDTVLHISRYHPMYKMNIKSTSAKTMFKLFEIAEGYLDFVYLGNLHSEKGQNTYCPACKKTVIERSGYYTKTNGIDKNGDCVYCNTNVIKYC
ncbi:MAG: AmmeMemoRadiSam system radical SAM enzyme [Bacteroidetes bacterium 4572_117]|nr:MAG: AmmeMemoRadiSam system radical SAM enzyme [Bacteroidetes bacterium 4572_117]